MESAGLLDRLLRLYANTAIVKIKDRNAVEEKLGKLASFGFSGLQVISDFDMTLTRFHKDGERCDTCHASLDNSIHMPIEFRDQNNALRAKYYPMEIDPNLAHEVKVPMMVQWVKDTQDLVISFKTTKSVIKIAVRDSKAFLRDNTEILLDKLSAHGIPLLIVSAGIGQVVLEILELNHVLHPNTKVISNYIEFDESGIAKKFIEPLLHMYNKHNLPEIAKDYFDSTKSRKGVILLGDGAGDLQLENCFKSSEDFVVLKIGFLNDNVEERLDNFMNGFDIVLPDEQSMEFVNLLVELIEGSKLIQTKDLEQTLS